MEKEFGDSIVSQKAFIPEIWANIMARRILDDIKFRSMIGFSFPTMRVTRFDRFRWWFEENVFWRFAKHKPDMEDD